MEPTSNQENLRVASEAFSLVSLLERGINCARQGSYVEAAAFFVLAREGVAADQVHFVDLINAFLQSQAGYWMAQESLQLAKKQVIETDIERKIHLLALEKLLLILRMEPKISEAYQPPQLQQQPHLTLTDSNHSTGSSGKPSSLQRLPKDGEALPDLYISCFGRFEVKRLDQPIVLCRSRSGQTFLRFLIAQDRYRASVDKLMDVLWAQDAPETARHKLQIAASAVRSSLNNGYHCDPGRGYILCKNGFYQINASVTVRTDVDEFLSLWQAGRRAGGSEAIALFERACDLCGGPFLAEDMYADWSSIRREQLKQIYVTMCRSLSRSYLELRHYEDAVKWTNAILQEDYCDEAAYRQLIQIYAAQGRRSEALQQYYRCEHILFKELGVSPALETTNLLQAIQNSTDLPLQSQFPVK